MRRFYKNPKRQGSESSGLVKTQRFGESDGLRVHGSSTPLPTCLGPCVSSSWLFLRDGTQAPCRGSAES